MRLTDEINSREHFSVSGFTREPFAVSSRWFENACDVGTDAVDVLVGTELRAPYQRKKGRDLFDLAIALEKATVTHYHIHLIPRRTGDSVNPRGGVRGVIAGKADYSGGR